MSISAVQHNVSVVCIPTYVPTVLFELPKCGQPLPRAESLFISSSISQSERVSLKIPHWGKQMEMFGIACGGCCRWRVLQGERAGSEVGGNEWSKLPTEAVPHRGQLESTTTGTVSQ